MVVILDQAREQAGSNPAAEPPKKRGGGPKTPEGILNSSRNSTTHGLRATVLLPADLAATVKERTAQFIEQIQPQTPLEFWLVGDIALNSARIDRCAELLQSDLERTIERALLIWDDDRREAA